VNSQQPNTVTKIQSSEFECIRGKNNISVQFDQKIIFGLFWGRSKIQDHRTLRKIKKFFRNT
jgi:hypothetical protein